MFSFVKWLKQFISTLKQKKGLWFTILSTIAILGIALSMFLMMSMTTNVAKDVYVNMAQSYSKTYNNFISNKGDFYKQISSTITSDLNLLDNMSKGNTTATNALLKIYNDNYMKKGIKDFEISFYSATNQINQYRNSVNAVINSKNTLFGVEVLSEGIFIVLIEPVYNDDQFVGVIEIKEPFHNMKTIFSKFDQVFLFAMDKKMIGQLSLEAKQNPYEDLFNNLKVERSRYNGTFQASILKDGDEAFDELAKNKYYVDDVYYKTYEKISDINGVDIGAVIIGEQIDGSSAFVNIVDNMTKTVTTVALGLMISILLFMF